MTDDDTAADLVGQAQETPVVEVTPPATTSQEMVMSYTSEYHEGPLPSPNTLREYESIVPGSAERILTAFETQSAHRISLETKVVDNSIKSEHRGQWLGFILSVMVFALAGFAMSNGQSLAGVALIVGQIVALVAVWTRSSRARSSDIDRNRSAES